MWSHLNAENLKALSPYFSKDDTVIVAPLNWGMGHAARCIPIIQWLRSMGVNVILASDGTAGDLLRKEFPTLAYHELPSYHIRYRYHSILKNIWIGMPKMLLAIYHEHSEISVLVKRTGATKVLSDNRLGCYDKQGTNYYLTHQVNILHENRMVRMIGSYIHRWFISKYDTCFIPDYGDDRALCPAMSSAIGDKYIHIGPITRVVKTNSDIKYDIVVLLSGPEPQRAILENLICGILAQMPEYRVLLIRGTRDIVDSKLRANHIKTIKIATSDEIEQALNCTKLLICRSGYTTLMDILSLGLKAILIPTPGQTEQEYLATHHGKNVNFINLNQNEINKLQKTIKSLI